MVKESKLNTAQLTAAKHFLGPLQVIAGAGTGKTQVITERIVNLIKHNLVDGSKIVALTFTDKAAREMETRLSQHLKRYIFDVNITTFNAFGHQLLQSYGLDIGLNNNLRVMNLAQQLVFMREHLNELKLSYYSPVTRPEAMLGEIADYFSQLKQLLITPTNYSRYASDLKSKAKDKASLMEAKRHLELAHAYGYYQKICRTNNIIDFEDQIYLCVELLKQRPNLLKKLQARYQFWLVDEFQDTNRAQATLLELLGGTANNVMAVGDDDQSIYGFRGAALSNILNFKTKYPKTKQIALIKNYRSSQQILDSAYRLIQHNNPNRLEAKYKLNKRLQAGFNGSNVKFKHFNAIEDEATWIAADIKKRLRAKQLPGAIAVLIRKRSQSAILARHFDSMAVEFSLVGETLDLYVQPQVKQMLNWLRVVADPHDSESLYHLLCSNIYNIDPLWLREVTVTAKAQHSPLEKVLAMADDVPNKVSQFLEQLQIWRKLISKLSVGQLAYQLLNDSGYLHRLVAKAKKDPELEQQVSLLSQFFRSLSDFEQIAQDTTVVGYLKNLPTLFGSGEYLANTDTPDSLEQTIKILTVHKSKGLEFETVYIFDLAQDSFPARKLHTSLELPDKMTNVSAELSVNPQLEEERRLMYVAMTRAKKDLILSFSFNRGGRRMSRPSVFIEEALGPQPQLDQLRTPQPLTDQIALFRPSINNPKHKPVLPPTLLQNKQLVLTVAQVQDYLNCPAEFYLRHILSPPQAPNFALEYGTLMHAAIQLYNRHLDAGKVLKLTALEAYLRDNWPKEGFLSTQHSKRALKQALKSIRAFYRREQKSQHKPLLSEQSFELGLDSNKLLIRGRFDAVLPSDGGVEIRDYKTGASNVNSQARADQRAKDSIQLAIYALAWQQLKGEMPAVVSLDFIDAGLVGRAVKNSRQLQSMQQKLERVAAGVRAFDFKPSGTHLFCSHMDYGF